MIAAVELLGRLYRLRIIVINSNDERRVWLSDIRQRQFYGAAQKRGAILAAKMMLSVMRDQTHISW